MDHISDFHSYLFINQYVNGSTVSFIDKSVSITHTHTQLKCWVWAVFNTNEANQKGAHSNRDVIGCAALLRSSWSWDADEEPMGIEKAVFLL